MKQLVLFSLALLALCVSGCHEESVAPYSSGVTSLQATAEHHHARVAFDPDGTFFWTEGDQIGVLMPSVDANAFQVMDLQSGAGTGSASFTSTTVAALGDYAVYPMSTEHKFNQSGEALQLTYHLSSYLNRKPAGMQTDFHEGVKSQTPSFNAPMFGQIVDGKVNFRHLGGVLCLKVKGLVSDEQNITVSADQDLYGDFQVDLKQPVPVMVTRKASSKSEVGINFFNKNGLTSGIFYVPVPTGTYENLTVKVQHPGGVATEKNFGTVTIDRCMLKVLNNTTVTATVDDANAALEKGVNIVELSGADPKPLVIPATGEKTVLIGYSGETSKIALTAKADNTAPQNVNLQFNGKQKGELDLSLPHASVELQTSAPVTFDKVTVKTAENTLVVKKDITIKEMTVEGGNVILKEGAKVESVSKAEGTAECKLYAEQGAIVPKKIQGPVKVVSADQCVALTNKEPFVAPVMAAIEMEVAGMLLPADTDGQYGICYSDSKEMPTIEDMKAEISFHKEPPMGGKVDPTLDDFTNVVRKEVALRNLSPEKTYHYRPYISYKQDGKMVTVYGEAVKTLTTPELQLSTEEYVDLGLSVLWGTRNLGAVNLEDEGNGYCWGSTVPDGFTSSDNTTVYDATTLILKPEHDAATHVKGAPWRMPTNAELNELKGCYFIDYELNGKKGYLVIGSNGNYIFLPKKHYEKEQIAGHNVTGWYVGYWTSERDENWPRQACCLFDGITDSYRNGLTVETIFNREVRYLIRPVRNK